MEWETVIGLEVHCQLNTKSKLFSGSATAYGAKPNSQANIIDLGLPGTLPVLNKAAVEKAVQFGLAINAKINNHSIFARKNYFYPDLPKGYQISQFELPIVGHGHLDIQVDEQVKRINIERAHLEEDAGKSLHDSFADSSGIDLNRAGTPLIEIVSAPELSNAKEAVAYLKNLYAIVCYLEICDGNLQEGSFRCDANVSVRPVGQKELGTRTEIKNVNSFRFVEKAINYEVDRQIACLEDGGTITQETRLYDADKNETRAMRSKEEANDYRYFPDPDLLPVPVSKELIETLKANLPELPKAKCQRLQETYQLSAYDAELITNSKTMADYFEQALKFFKKAGAEQAKLIANWMLGELSAALNKAELDISQSPITADNLAALIARIQDKTLSSKTAKLVFNELWEVSDNNIDIDKLIADKGFSQVTDQGAIEQLVQQVINDFPEQVAEYRGGKEKVIGFLVGKVMQASQGRAAPAQVNQLLIKMLKKT